MRFQKVEFLDLNR